MPQGGKRKKASAYLYHDSPILFQVVADLVGCDINVRNIDFHQTSGLLEDKVPSMPGYKLLSATHHKIPDDRTPIILCLMILTPHVFAKRSEERRVGKEC